jgi:hypothetical protein
MDTGFKLEEVGVNEPLDESGTTFSDFEPAAIGGNRQQLHSVAGQPCCGDLLLLAEAPVLGGICAETLAHGVNIGITKAPIQ